MKSCQIAAVATLSLILAQSGFCAGSSDKISHPAKATNQKEAVQSVVPAYVYYTPFKEERYRAVPRQEIADGLHRAIRIGLDKAQATSTRISIVCLTSQDDIQALKTLLKEPQKTAHTRSFADTYFLLDADRGETEIFVDKDGLVSQGTRLWQLSPQDFAQLRQVLNRVYATILGQR